MGILSNRDRAAIRALPRQTLTSIPENTDTPTQRCEDNCRASRRGGHAGWAGKEEEGSQVAGKMKVKT